MGEEGQEEKEEKESFKFLSLENGMMVYMGLEVIPRFESTHSAT